MVVVFLKYSADAFGLICGLGLLKGVLNGYTFKADFRNAAEFPYLTCEEFMSLFAMNGEITLINCYC